jgi:hypothetical protein
VGQQANKSRRKHDAFGGIFVLGWFALSVMAVQAGLFFSQIEIKKAITAMRQWPWFYRSEVIIPYRNGFPE